MKKKNEQSNNKPYEVKNREIITVKPNTLHSKNAKQLSINEQRILFYSIYKIQHSQNTVSFTKQELKEAFGVDFGSYKEVYKYLTSLRSFGIDVESEKDDRLLFVNAFTTLYYDQGIFEFKFSEEFLPVVGDQKRFLQLGMQSVEQFKSHYSSYLYQWLKGNMWGIRRVVENIGLAEFKAIFKLEPSSYKGDNSHFRSRVWAPAVKEINNYTNYEIKIVAKGRGEAIRYTIIRIQNEDLAKQQAELKKGESGQKFECKLGLVSISGACSKCLRINKCPMHVSGKAWAMIPESDTDTLMGLECFLYYTFWDNENYDLITRIKNGVACQEELDYYSWIKDVCNIDEDENAVDENEMRKHIAESRKDFYAIYLGIEDS